jgi:hypothetical protein
MNLISWLPVGESPFQFCASNTPAFHPDPIALRRLRDHADA